MPTTPRNASRLAQESLLAPADAADRLLLDLAEIHEPVTVIGDEHGALTLTLASRGVSLLRSHTDSAVARAELMRHAAAAGLTDWTAVATDGRPVGTESVEGAEASMISPTPSVRPTSSVGEPPLLPSIAAALDGARTVIWRLPKALAEVREVAADVARHASPDVVCQAGARIKYLTPATPMALERAFREVTVSLARQKSRVLTARGPRPVGSAAAMASRVDPELGITVLAAGGVFGGPAVDGGARLLLSFRDAMKPDARSAVDLGSGTGVLAVVFALTRPDLAVTAVDASARAVASTRATAQANGAALATLWDDGGASLPARSFDLVLLNPPFHTGGSIDEGAAHRMIRAAGRLLAPGGELWSVYNSHLHHRRLLSQIGPTEQIGRDRRFTVTRTRGV